jgi:four helix bundle protein
VVWQREILLVSKIYSLTRGFAKGELFGLTSQLHRAAVSVPSNVAEGQQRGSDNESKRYLAIALASLAEMDTHLTIARELGYVDRESVRPLAGEILELRRMRYGLKASLTDAR